MPLYDCVCPNGHQVRDLYKKVNDSYPLCKVCGENMETLWDSSSNVVGDEIPGGVWIEHGVCNQDGSPRKFYSKSEIAKAAKAAGLVNYVRHAPGRDSDKSKHTTKWF